MAKALITVERVEALPVGTELRDTRVAGFCVRRQMRDAHYYLDANIKGVRKHLTIGRHGPGEWTPEKARGQAIKLKGLILEGRDPVSERDQERAVPVFAHLAQRYVSEHGAHHWKPGTRSVNLNKLKLHILPALGKHKFPLSIDLVARLHGSMAATPTTGNGVLELVSAIIAWGEKVGAITKGANPCPNIKRYPRKDRERFLSAEELGRLGRVLDAPEWND